MYQYQHRFEKRAWSDAARAQYKEAIQLLFEAARVEWAQAKEKEVMISRLTNASMSEDNYSGRGGGRRGGGGAFSHHAPLPKPPPHWPSRGRGTRAEARSTRSRGRRQADAAPPTSSSCCWTTTTS